MTRKKSPAELNSRVIRVPLGTYAALRQAAIQAQVSIGEVVEALTKLESVKERKPEVLPAQIPLSFGVSGIVSKISPAASIRAKGVKRG